MNLKCLVDYKIINSDEEITKECIPATYDNKKLIFEDDNDSIEITLNDDFITLEKEKNRIYKEYEIWFDQVYSGFFKYEISIKEM